jgi:tetratricopeptide (TPR) repeat protein
VAALSPALDDSLAEPHASLAGVLYRYRWEWQAAEREFRRSLKLEPNYAEGRRAYGIYLGVMRRFDESVAELGRAQQLNPLSQSYNMEFVQALFFAGRRDEALAALDRARGQFPRASHRAHVLLAFDHILQRRWDEAISAFEKGTDPARPTHWLGFVYGVGGRTMEGRAILAALHQRANTEYVSLQDFGPFVWVSASAMKCSGCWSRRTSSAPSTSGASRTDSLYSCTTIRDFRPCFAGWGSRISGNSRRPPNSSSHYAARRMGSISRNHLISGFQLAHVWSTK